MKLFRWLVMVLVVAALGILGAQWLGQDSVRNLGEVIVHTGGRDYIATVPQAIVAVLIFIALLWLLWALLAAPFRAWQRHRRRQGRARLIDGLLALDYGQWQRAEKLLVAAASEPRLRAVAHVGALRAAEARGDTHTAAQHLLALANESAPLHALHSAERWLQLGQYEQALAALATAPQPLPPRALDLQATALAGAGRAADAYGLLGALRQQQVHDAATLGARETALATQMLAQSEDVNQLATHWEVLPKTLRLTPEVITAYAQRAAALEWSDTAVRALEQALDSQWDDGLVPLYAQLSAASPGHGQAQLERWLHTRPDNAAVQLAAAQLAAQQGQWSQALQHAQRAQQLGAGAGAWEVLGDAYAGQRDFASAAVCLRNALYVQRGQSLPSTDTALAAAPQAPVVELRDEHGIPHLPPSP